MRICILETDIPTDKLKAEHGDFADMFVEWLSPAMPDTSWDSVKVYDNAALPRIGEFDGYMITGCRHGVYDPLPWLDSFCGFLRHLRDARIPVGGVCFGHQVMAHAYGGKVALSPEGWVLGADSYDGKVAIAVHQDQVHSAPDVSRTIAGSARCAIGRIEYEFPALSVQYHPEFTPTFMQALLDEYETTRIDKALTDTARETLNQRFHTGELAQDFARLFERAGHHRT